MGGVDGRVAFITGAARGQGRSHAVRLAREGADIIALDICHDVQTTPYALATQDDLDETARLVRAEGRRIVARPGDVRDLAAIKAVVDEGVAEFGRLDIVVANAGIGGFPAAPLTEIDELSWETIVDINLNGVWRTLKVAVPHIVAGQRGGSIVITSSMAAILAYENIGHYAAAKAGLIALMRVLALELVKQSVRVNTVHPTNVNTPLMHNEDMYRLFRPDLEVVTRDDFNEAARTLNKMPLVELQPEDVTDLVYFLVSDASKWITGQQLVVDAGATL